MRLIVRLVSRKALCALCLRMKARESVTMDAQCSGMADAMHLYRCRVDWLVFLCKQMPDLKQSIPARGRRAAIFGGSARVWVDGLSSRPMDWRMKTPSLSPRSDSRPRASVSARGCSPKHGSAFTQYSCPLTAYHVARAVNIEACISVCLSVKLCD